MTPAPDLRDAVAIRSLVLHHLRVNGPAPTASIVVAVKHPHNAVVGALLALVAGGEIVSGSTRDGVEYRAAGRG